jgi:hypothetical protein
VVVPGGGLGRAARNLRAPRLDDAAIKTPQLVLDTPPPVRTPTPVIVSPPRRIPTPPPMPTPVRTHPQIIDWEVPSEVDKLPVSHARGVAIALLVLAIAGTLIATGWYRKLPGGAALRQRIHEWTRPPGSAAAPAPPAPPAPPAAETTAAPDVQPRGGAATVRPAPEPAPDVAAADETARTAAPRETHAPAAAPRDDAPPAKPRARHRSAARPHRDRTPAPRFAAPPPPLPADSGRPAQVPPAQVPPAQVPPGTTPPLNGKAFEIAPPTTAPIEPGRDLAPGNDERAAPILPP